MKMLLTDHARIGSYCSEQLSVAQSHAWHQARLKRIRELAELAVKLDAGYLALTGKLLGNTRISESLIDSVFSLAAGKPNLHFMFFLTDSEFRRLSYRKDYPDNLHLIRLRSKDDYIDEQIALRISDDTIELQLGDHPSVLVHCRKMGDSVIEVNEKVFSIPCFEPLGFDNAARQGFGILSLEWDDNTIPIIRQIPMQHYAFREAKLELSPAETQREILQKLRQSAAKLERNTFLRLTICGRTAFGITMDAAAMKQELEKQVFFAQVFDTTEMDIDAESFETDISLSSEFVRLALSDDTLSDAERSRLICRGWNALGGKAVSE